MTKYYIIMFSEMLDNVSPVTCFLLMEASVARARWMLMILPCCCCSSSSSLKSVCSTSIEFPLKCHKRRQHLSTSSIYIGISLIFPPYLDLDSRLFIFATVRERVSFSSGLRSSSNSTSMSRSGMDTFCGVDSWKQTNPTIHLSISQIIQTRDLQRNTYN